MNTTMTVIIILTCFYICLSLWGVNKNLEEMIEINLRISSSSNNNLNSFKESLDNIEEEIRKCFNIIEKNEHYLQSMSKEFQWFNDGTFSSKHLKSLDNIDEKLRDIKLYTKQTSKQTETFTDTFTDNTFDSRQIQKFQEEILKILEKISLSLQDINHYMK